MLVELHLGPEGDLARLALEPLHVREKPRPLFVSRQKLKN